MIFSVAGEAYNVHAQEYTEPHIPGLPQYPSCKEHVLFATYSR